MTTIDPLLLDRLLSSPKLPSIPAVAVKIVNLVQQEEVSVDDIAEAIALDPALASNMLKTVNSSFYGLPKTVGSVQQAVVVLGLSSVQTLALGFSLVSKLKESSGVDFDQMAYWRRSLYCATASKLLCETLNIVQAEEIFIASLLQDVGVLALVQVLGGEYTVVFNAVAGDHHILGALEVDQIGIDHAEVGGMLAESWGLPPLFVEAIRWHEKADEADESLQGLIRVVNAGAFAADAIDHAESSSYIETYYQRYADWFGIEADEAEQLLQAIGAKAKETQRLFALPTGQLDDPDEILARAKKALEQLGPAEADTHDQSSGTDRESLDPSVRDLATGLLNRRQFDEKLDERFLVAGPDKPLSLIFVDLDHLKSINETYGQNAREAVLVATAQAVAQTVESQGDAFRYGEEQFLVLAVGMTRNEAAVMAEQIRQNIINAMSRVSLGDQAESPRVTGSIGVATYDGSVFKRSGQLVQAADRGAYAAKTSGRNTVRVFVPKAA